MRRRPPSQLAWQHRSSGNGSREQHGGSVARQKFLTAAAAGWAAADQAGMAAAGQWDSPGAAGSSGGALGHRIAAVDV